MTEPEKLIPLHGGYRKLKSFQVAKLAYEAFETEGGFSERLYRVRSQRRSRGHL